MAENNWTYQPLSELCDINIGKTPARANKDFWGQGHTWVSISDLKSKVIEETKEEITDVALAETNIKQVQKGTLLMSFKLSIGKLAFAGKDLYTNEAIVSLPVKEGVELNKHYLYYALKFIPLKGGNQAAMGKTLNKKSLSALSIPLPPTLDDQKRIAKILSDCEALIQKRKDSIELLNELLKSTFYEMFGDPINNEKSWKLETIESLVTDDKYSIKRGPFGGALKKEIFVDDGYLVYEQYHALNNDFKMARYFIDEKKYQELKAFTVNPGDIIISCSGVYLGKLAVIPPNARKGIINQALLKVTLDESKMLNTMFLAIFQNPNFKRRFFGVSRGSGVPNFPPMTSFKKFEFICPPIDLQIQYSNKVDNINEIKSSLGKSLFDLEKLYGGISQRAFKGELGLDKVDISNMEEDTQEKPEMGENPQEISEQEFEKMLDSFEHKLPDGEIPLNRDKNIRNINIRQYLGFPPEVQGEEDEYVEFGFMDKDFFYQFILKDGFSGRTFTIDELEAYSRKYILRGTGFEFTYENWKYIIFRFLGAKNPLLDQVLDEKDKTVKLQLTDETYKA